MLVFLDSLHCIDQHGRAVGGEVDGRRKAPGIAGLGQELLRRGGVVPEIALALAELIEGDGPLLEAGRNGRIHDADSLQRGVHDRRPVDGHGHGPAHADVAEWRLVGAHGKVVHDVGGKLRRLEVGAQSSQVVLDLHPVGAIDGPGVLPADVVLAAEERRHTRRIVFAHEDLDAVDVGRPATK